jgi:hypothetical protein
VDADRNEPVVVDDLAALELAAPQDVAAATVMPSTQGTSQVACPSPNDQPSEEGRLVRQQAGERPPSAIRGGAV